MSAPSRLQRLRRELQTMRERYDVAPPSELADLETALRRRATRIDHLTDQIDELLDEMSGLERERDGLVAGMEALVAEHLDEVRARFGECWSPTPVFGYRMWAVGSDGLAGAVERWPGPSFHARCSKLPSNPDVPHTDIRCAGPQCGIYATKAAVAALGIRDEHDSRWALGLVALEGKVVEHRHGYRAASATAISVVARSAERTLFTDDPRILAVLFDRPVDTIALFGEPADRWPDERIVTDLTMEERRQRWTSDPYSG